MRWVTIFAVGLAAIALAGCGGSSSSTTTTTTTTETSAASTTSTESTTSATTTEASGSTIPNFASGKCKDLAASASKISQQFGASSATGNLQNAAKEFQAFVAIAPSEIKGDVQTIADAMTSYANAMKGIDLKSGQVPSAADLQKIAAASKSLNQAKLQAAEQHIAAWTQKNCGG